MMLGEGGGNNSTCNKIKKTMDQRCVRKFCSRQFIHSFIPLELDDPRVPGHT